MEKMEFTVKNRRNGKVYYVFKNRQDAENAILHLEDMYGIDYRDIIIEEKEV